jgi:hypothetical protein
VRDEDGIARGGIRLPQVEVPVAHNSAIQQTPGVFARLVGFHHAFPLEKVRERYGTRERYLDLYVQAARSAQKSSVVLARDVEPLIDEARAACPL